ncbi:hypothetical protein, partial [Desulfobacter sp.]|uniref:hypothetical protein n=1 Tax=Desulfobacter sp. TaxID=2294 RepID=UPI0025803449
NEDIQTGRFAGDITDMQKSNNYKPIGRFIPHRIKDSEGDFSARKLKKNNPEISRSISFEELQMPIADIGCIHTYKKAG